jgi:L-aminopeptidase/D-esterase-like protein
MTNWKITQMDRHTSTGFVVTVHWTAALQDGDYGASTYSTASFTEQPSQELIPYEELTEELVIGWVKDSLGEEAVEAVEQALLNNIEDQRTPKVSAGLPW